MLGLMTTVLTFRHSLWGVFLTRRSTLWTTSNRNHREAVYETGQSACLHDDLKLQLKKVCQIVLQFFKKTLALTKRGGYKFLLQSISRETLILRMQRDFSVAQMCCQSPVSFSSPACVLPSLLPLILSLRQQAWPAKPTGRDSLFCAWFAML